MLFKLRTSEIHIDTGIDGSKIADNVIKAVRTRAESLVERYRQRIVTDIYSHVKERTGTIGKAVLPFVVMSNNSITLGFNFDVSKASYLVTHIMMTPDESPYKTISARAHLLTVPLSEKLFGKSAKNMNLSVIPTKTAHFLGTSEGGVFTPSFVLEHSVKVPKRVKMYEIMEDFEKVAISEITKVAQDALNKSLTRR